MILGTILLLGSIVLLYRNFQIKYRSVYFIGLLLKLIFGITLGLIYKYYYDDGDTFHYYHDALIVNNVIASHPLVVFSLFFSEDWSYLSNSTIHYIQQARALTFSKFLGLLLFLSGKSYWLLSLWLSFLSYLGIYIFVDFCRKRLPKLHHSALAIFMFIPSIVFWSSGVIKEVLALPAILLITIPILKIFIDKKLEKHDFILLLLAGLILGSIKYYVLAALLLSFAPFVAIELWFKNLKAKWIVWAIFTILLLGVGPIIHPNFTPDNFFAAIVRSHDFIVAQNGEGAIHFYYLEPHILAFLINAPLALFSGLFRPMVFEIDSALSFIVSLENIVILGLTVYYVIK